jgi:hypothetical protein
MPADSRFDAAIRRIDALHALDPNDQELTYARRMSAWLDRLEPAASEALRLATRAQHLMRWEIPRDSYPMDRTGYHRWRTRLYDVQADRAAEVLKEVGYDADTIARVRSLIRKEAIKQDAESQTLEDVVCLVFLENYFAEFARDHDEQKLVTILRRTWRKMSDRGHATAMTIELGPRERALVAKALEAPPSPA